MGSLIVSLVTLAVFGVLLYVFRQQVLRGYERSAIFLKEVRVEMQKVVWPSKEEVKGATFVVLVSVVILTFAIGFEDFILSKILGWILERAKG